MIFFKQEYNFTFFLKLSFWSFMGIHTESWPCNVLHNYQALTASWPRPYCPLIMTLLCPYYDYTALIPILSCVQCNYPALKTSKTLPHLHCTHIDTSSYYDCNMTLLCLLGCDDYSVVLLPVWTHHNRIKCSNFHNIFNEHISLSECNLCDS